MKLQVLMSVMNQKDHSIIKRSNIRGDAIIINQCEEFKKEVLRSQHGVVQFFHFDEKGVGLSRNNALMRADADVVLFSDDDITYVDDYIEIVERAFRVNPGADILMFNVLSDNPSRPSASHSKTFRIRKFNSLKYGTYRMAVRLDAIRKKNINFSLLFGGGAKYSSGEDSLFIFDALNAGLKILAIPKTIARVSHEKSTWFSGYDDKFFYDKGVLYGFLSPTFAKPLCMQFVLRKYSTFETTLSRRKIIGRMYDGIKDARS